MAHSATTPAVTEGAYKPFRWFILATLVVVVAVQAIALITPAPLIGEIIKTTSLSPGEVTWMTMGTWNLFVAIAAILGGPLIDKFGFKWMYIFGMVMIGIGWLLMPAIGDNFMGMTVARAVQAIGGGPIMAAGVYVSATCFPKKERAMVNGFLGAAMGLGIMAGLNLGPASMAAVGDWAVGLRNLWPLAVVGILMTVIVMVGPKVAPEGAGMEHLDEAAAASNLALYKKAILMPLTWIATACVVIASWFNQAYNDMTPGYLALDPPVGLGLGAAGAGSIASLAQIGNIVGCLVVGIIVERLFHGKARPALMVAFAGMAVGAGLLLVPGINTNQVMLTTVMLITVFFLGWINASALGWIAKNYPAEITGKLGGMAQGIGIFGGLAGVAAGSAALHATDHYVVSTFIMVGVAIVGVIVSFFMQTHKHHDLESPAPETVTSSGV
ncbi:MAG: MFS transporter [Propionicimonas sp.]|uniref:MFS transporter n=1 Tax=Propionicimonas sp. TaxID=1955623 RepID=UPI002B21E01D|nr:MFS transporter [Propionicimonas sp.]MEA4944011.1 MFS transporter [Propionicimonas sp.]